MNRVDELIDELFLKHPRENNEDYVSHGWGALQMAFHSGIGAMALSVHAIVPGLFPDFGSRSLENAMKIKKEKMEKKEKKEKLDKEDSNNEHKVD